MMLLIIIAIAIFGFLIVPRLLWGKGNNNDQT